MAKRRPSGDGSVRKRADGRWEGRIVAGRKDSGSPIFKYVHAKTQKDLLEKLHTLKSEYQDGNLSEESNITLSEWLHKWLDVYMKVKIRQSTYCRYLTMIDKYICPALGSKKVSSVSTSDVQKMYNYLKENGRIKSSGENKKQLSDAMIRAIHMLIHQAMDTAVRGRIIIKNPTEGTVIPKISYKDKEILNDRQLQIFLDAIKQDEVWHDFFYTVITTGLRRGEACGLRWEDFNENDKTLRISRTVRIENGVITTGETKTDAGSRTILLPESTAVVLKNRKETLVGEWIFPNPLKPEEPVNPTSAYNRLKKILREANLPSIRFHDLRHTFATHALTGGVDPKTLSGILGHTKASFTLDTYTHVTTDMQKNAAVIVGGFMEEIFGKELKPWQKEKAEQEL